MRAQRWVENSCTKAPLCFQEDGVPHVSFLCFSDSVLNKAHCSSCPQALHQLSSAPATPSKSLCFRSKKCCPQKEIKFPMLTAQQQVGICSVRRSQHSEHPEDRATGALVRGKRLMCIGSVRSPAWPPPRLCRPKQRRSHASLGGAAAST